MPVEQDSIHSLTAQPETTPSVVSPIGPQLAPHPDGEFVARRFQDLASQVLQRCSPRLPFEQAGWNDIGYWETVTPEPGINGYRRQAEYTLSALKWVRFGFSDEIPPRIVDSMDLEYADSKVRALWWLDAYRILGLPGSVWPLLHNASARAEDRRFKRKVSSRSFQSRLRTADDIVMVDDHLDRRYALVLTTMENDLCCFDERRYLEWVRFLGNYLSYQQEIVWQ